MAKKTCPAKSLVTTIEDDEKWKDYPVKDSPDPLLFRIEKKDVEKAKPKDPCNCVVAVALKARLGPFLERVIVGTSITKVIIPNLTTRFRTPEILRKAIPVFDETKLWNLPAGDYQLLACKSMENNHKTIKNGKGPNGPGKIPQVKIRAMPTRIVPRAILRRGGN